MNLACDLNGQDSELVAQRSGFSLGIWPREAAEMIGLGGAWRIKPGELLRSYVSLAAAPRLTGAARLLSGMALCARFGTAEAVGHSLRGNNVLAKTGTAPCVHARRAPGDGLVLILYPADQPRLALLVREHGVPGSRAADVGGKILSTVVNGR